MRTYNGGTPCSLLGWGEGGSSPAMSFLPGHSVGPLSFPFGGSRGATEVNFTQQQLEQLLGPDLKCSASLLGGAAIEKLAFEVQPNGCSQKPGWVHTVVPMQETMLGGSRTFSSWDRHSSAVIFRGGSWTGLR